MNNNQLNSDDLDQLYKGIQSKLEGKEDILNQLIPKFQEKYKYLQIEESNKKLLWRFQLRLSELIEKCKNQNQSNYLIAIQQKLITFNFIQILDSIHNSKKEIKVKDIIPQFKQLKNWQQYNKINKSLFEFYEIQFWRLYGILLLNEENIDNMILYYQSKSDNVERLLKISLERNKQFSYIQQQYYPELATIEYKAQQMNLCQMNCTMENPYQNKNISMFGILTQNQKQNNRYNYKSPKKILTTNFIKKGWSFENNECQPLDSIDKRTRIYSKNTSNNSIIFSNQTVRERTQNQSFSQKNTFLKREFYINKTPLNKKKISSIDMNQSFNQFAMSAQSVSPKRLFKKPKMNQNLNQSFYKQLFPSQKSTDRPSKIMKNILFNESKGIHNNAYSNVLFNQKQLKY